MTNTSNALSTRDEDSNKAIAWKFSMSTFIRKRYVPHTDRTVYDMIDCPE